MSLRFTGSQLRGMAVLLVGLSLALVWMHPEVALHGRVYASADAQAAAAFQMAGERSLAEGEYPYWNPYVFAGMPSYASLAYNPGVYPLTGPIKAVRDTLGLPPMTWLLFHLWWMGLGMAAYLRWRGASWASALVGGALLMSLPKVLAWSAYGHGTKLGTFAWFPWAIWAAEAVLKTGSRRWVAWLALVLSAQLLRGHVQIVYYTVLTIGVWVVAHLVAELRGGTSPSRALPRAGWIAAAGLLALGVAATLYLPVLEYQGWSIRGAAGGSSAAAGNAFDYATSWSMRFSEIATLWWPTAVGYGRASYVGGMPFTDYPHYMGFPVLLFAGLGVALRRDRWTWAAVGLGVFATLLALGKYGPLYHLVYDILPGFKRFRVPVMVLCLQHFAILVLAVGGLDSVLERLARADRPRWLGVPFLAALGLLGVGLLVVSTVGAAGWTSALMGRWSDMATHAGRMAPPASALRAAAELASSDALRMGAILLALAALAVVTVRRRVPSAAVIAVVGLLLFLDLWRVDQPLVHPEKHLPTLARQGQRLVAVASESMIQAPRVVDEYTSPSPLSDWLFSQQERPRVWPITGPRTTDNVLAAHGVVSLGGYHAAKLKVYQDYRERLYTNGRPEVRLANLLGAEFVLSEQRFAESTLETLERMGLRLSRTPGFESDEGVVYRNETAYPRAWLVHDFDLEQPSARTTDELPQTSVLDRLLSPGFDPMQRVIVSETPSVPAVPAGSAGQATVVAETAHHLRYDVQTDAAGIVVMSEIFYPEWEARLDGDPVPLMRADHALRAVAVPAGAHVLELDYRAGSHRLGLWIRWISLFLIVGVGSWPPTRWRHGAPQGGVEGR